MREANSNVHPLATARQQASDSFEDDDVVTAEDDHKVLVPEPGPYVAKYTGHSTALLFGKRAAKVFLNFEVIEGPFQGTKLGRPFRAKTLVGRSGPRGKFKLSKGGDLYRVLVRLLDANTRPDRISLQPLRHMLFRITTRTIKRDREDNELAEGAWYSMVDKIEDGR
jgi:hypothetical protein